MLLSDGIKNAEGFTDEKRKSSRSKNAPAKFRDFDLPARQKGRGKAKAKQVKTADDKPDIKTAVASLPLVNVTGAIEPSTPNAVTEQHVNIETSVNAEVPVAMETSVDTAVNSVIERAEECSQLELYAESVTDPDDSEVRRE